MLVLGIKYLKVKDTFKNLIFLMIFILSCTSSPVEDKYEENKVLQEFQIIYPYLGIIDSTWNISYIYDSEEHVQFEASKEDSTLQYNFVNLLKIRFEEESFPYPSTSYCYYVNFISYRWEDEEIDMHIDYSDKLDTIYHYYWEKGKSYTEDPIFIRGKYTYLFYYNRLTGGQMEYYQAHKDSLSRIMGNDVADLPEYSTKMED